MTTEVEAQGVAFPHRTVFGGISSVIIPEAQYLALTAGLPPETVQRAGLPSGATRPSARQGEVPPRHASEARRRAQVIEAVQVARERGASLTRAIGGVSAQRNIPAATIRGWMRRIAGAPREGWEPLLTPAWYGRAPTTIDANVLTYFVTLTARIGRPKPEFVYAETKRAAQANGWGKVPSLKTLQRRLKDASGQA